MQCAEDKKYRRYVDWEEGMMHAALLGAIRNVRFSRKTTKKALRAAFAAEF